MIRRAMTTRNDLLNWIDSVTSGWDGRTDEDVHALYDMITGHKDCPRWGADWTDFLNNLPMLSEMLYGDS